MLNKNSVFRIFNTCLAATIVGFSGLTYATGKLEPSIKAEVKIEKKAIDTQKRIDRLSEKTLDINQEYRFVLDRIETFKAYNYMLEQNIAQQEEEISSIQAQMNNIDDTERGLMPLMEKMIDSLDQFVELDVPFKKAERVKRVDTLRSTMLRADVSVSEKYRRILDAYMTEIKYGSEVTVYEDSMDVGGVSTRVDFLMFGRTTLVFATRGESPIAGMWDSRKRDWVSFGSGDETNTVLKAIKDVSRKSKKLIIVPVVSPEKA